MYVYKDLLSPIKFLHDKPICFLTWLCSRLSPVMFDEQEPIYTQGDEQTDIFFLSKGKATYVAPAINYKVFGSIKIGNVFGISDLILAWRKKHTHFCMSAKYDYFK